MLMVDSCLWKDLCGCGCGGSEVLVQVVVDDAVLSSVVDLNPWPGLIVQVSGASPSC